MKLKFESDILNLESAKKEMYWRFKNVEFHSLYFFACYIKERQVQYN